MTTLTAIVFVFLFMLVIQSKADIYEDQIVNTLLSNYTIYSRASESFYNTTNVTVSLTLNQILDVDEKNQIVTTYCWLLMVWNDPRLAWNESSYNGVNEVHLGSDRVWKPDIILYNSAEKETFSNDLTNVIVSSNGDVQWWVDSIFKSSCSINIEYFPYDVQNCTLMFSSWNYDITKIDALAGDADKSIFKENSEFVLKNFTVIKHVTKYDCCEYPYAEINFYIVIERRHFFYVFNMIIPCVMITLVSFIGFFMPASSGEKISVGITTLLSISVLLLVISADMPISDSIPLLGQFYAASMIIISLVTGATVLTLNIHHKKEDDKPIPRKIRKIFFSKFGQVIMFPSKIEIDSDKVHTDTNLKSSDTKYEIAVKPADLNNEISNSERKGKTQDDLFAIKSPNRILSANTNISRATNSFNAADINIRPSYSRLSCTPTPSIPPTAGNERNTEILKQEWNLLSSIIDRLLFYLFSLVTIVVMVAIVFQAPNAR